MSSTDTFLTNHILCKLPSWFMSQSIQLQTLFQQTFKFSLNQILTHSAFKKHLNYLKPFIFHAYQVGACISLTTIKIGRIKKMPSARQWNFEWHSLIVTYLKNSARQKIHPSSSSQFLETRTRKTAAKTY